ncbi:MAG: hypothetical protein M1482_15760 [Chloroflexi bacterium]|nr:hypothetical protein [Chloroflexota bacterium]
MRARLPAAENGLGLGSGALAPLAFGAGLRDVRDGALLRELRKDGPGVEPLLARNLAPGRQLFACLIVQLACDGNARGLRQVDGLWKRQFELRGPLHCFGQALLLRLARRRTGELLSLRFADRLGGAGEIAPAREPA